MSTVLFQAVTHFYSAIQPGGTLSRPQVDTLRSLMGFMPQLPAAQYVATMVRNQLAQTERNEMVATGSLPIALQLTQPYLKDVFESPDFHDTESVLTRLSAILDASGQGPLPAAAQLAGGLATKKRGPDFAVKNAVTRILDHIIRADRPVRMPEYLEMGGRRVRQMEDPIFAQRIRDYFGDGVTPQMFLNTLQVVEGYNLQSLHVARNDEGEISLQGIITNHEDEGAGNFQIIIPKLPAADEPWIADGRHFYISPRHRKKGLGGRLLLQFAAFLFLLHADGLDAHARTNGRAFWADKGFELLNRRALQDLKNQFADSLRNKDLLTDEIELQIASMRDLGQLVDYKIGDHFVGYTFLEKIISKALDLRFQLRPDYFGWLRLMPDIYPIEFDTLSEGVRTMLLRELDSQRDLKMRFAMEKILYSDEEEGHFLADWAAQKASPILAYLRKRELARGEGRDEPLSQQATELMNAVAQVMSMVHSLKGQPVEHYFKRLTNWAVMSDVVNAIRQEGISLAFDLPKIETASGGRT